MAETFTPCEDIDTLLDHVWIAQDAAVPREVRRFVEEWVPGKKLTERVEESIIDFLREEIADEDRLSARLDESYNIAERLKENLSGLEEDAREAREELEAERQRAADMDTETRGETSSPLHRSGHLVADDALNKDKNMTENTPMKTPTPNEILKMAEFGLTITSKKSAATSEVPWMHGRVVNRLVKEGGLAVLAEAAHEKEIKTTEKGMGMISPSSPPKVEDEEVEDDLVFEDEDEAEAPAPDEFEDAVAASVAPVAPDEDEDEEDAAERCVIYATLNDDGQMCIDINARALLALVAASLKS